jgi:hypothetical protein
MNTISLHDRYEQEFLAVCAAMLTDFVTVLSVCKKTLDIGLPFIRYVYLNVK